MEVNSERLRQRAITHGTEAESALKIIGGAMKAIRGQLLDEIVQLGPGDNVNRDWKLMSIQNLDRLVEALGNAVTAKSFEEQMVALDRAMQQRD